MDALAGLTETLANRYVIDREIGRGGMATVYLARDVRHDRPVALKVLNPELGAVLGVERFLSEIRVTANLQHPNVLPLFDSGESHGLLYYVMPFVEGESLRDRLNREKQLPVDEALQIAAAISHAVDYAHRHGVIHRDLKPENILLQDGQPVVADFGIALAVSNAGGSRVTQTGISLGTPHYMSPEQATGDRTVDGRSDIYSLAAVTYEMLAGEPPHDGKTSQAIIAKMLTDKPRSLRLARDTVPDQVDVAVSRALSKLPADRFGTANEFADALIGKVHGVTSPVATSTRRNHSALGLAPWAIAAAATAAAVYAWTRNDSPVAARSLRYEVALPTTTSLPTARGNPVAIAAGGRYVAYTAKDADGTHRLYVRAEDELVPREVSASEGATFPFFSPNGDTIAFWTGGQIKRAPVSGGASIRVATLARPERVSWTRDGWLITGDGFSLLRIPARGGNPVAFTSLDSTAGETSMLYPVALDDGNTVLYSSSRMGGALFTRIGVASIESGRRKVLDLVGSYPLGVLDGHLIYATVDGAVMAVAFDISSWEIGSEPVPLLDQIAFEATSSIAFGYLTQDGSFAYVSGITRRQISITSPDGSTRTLGDADAFIWPRFSPDGKRLAITVGTSALRDVFIYDLASGQMQKLTRGGTINDRPEWLPDGKAVLFRSNRGEHTGLWMQALDGTATASFVFGMPGAQVDEGMLSRDGRYLVFQRDVTGSGEVWYRPMQGDTTPIALDTLNAGAFSARFSNNGKMVAYTISDGSIQRVYVRPFPALSPRYLVSLADGSEPVWSADDKRIYYVSGGDLVAANIGSTEPFSVRSREVVLSKGHTFTAVHADYDIGPDGSIVALRSPDQKAQFVVVRNFGAELASRTGAAAKR